MDGIGLEPAKEHVDLPYIMPTNAMSSFMPSPFCATYLTLSRWQCIHIRIVNQYHRLWPIVDIRTIY